MMDIINILFNQILLMFVFMFVGVYLTKTKKLSLEGSKTLGSILLYVVIPAVVIKAFITEATPEKINGLIISLVTSIVCLGFSMIVSHIIFKKHPIENFSAAFSNAGFIGIPIVSALFGSEAVFYVSSFVAFLNIFQWTYGVFTFTKDKRYIQINKLVTNPIIISFTIALLLFITQMKVPTIIQSTIQQFSALNSPLAMFSLGCYLANVSMKQLFTNKLAYQVSFVRLIVIPLMTLLILSIFPKDLYMIKMTILVVASTPVGSNVAIFAQLYHQDYSQAVIDVCLSTLLCLITLPLMITITNFIW